MFLVLKKLKKNYKGKKKKKEEAALVSPKVRWGQSELMESDI